ncbi:ion transporter, partial [Lactobacillus reuteri]|nr:ion transporter [Limosilactobacillus reuteri]
NMLIGIGLIGMLTSSITGYFDKSSNDEIAELKQQNERLENKLDEIETLLKKENNNNRTV